MHYRVTVRCGAREGRGTTENLSERGAMLSVDMDPPLGSTDVVDVTITLPDGTDVRARGRVRWASSVLPGVVGVEFDEPVDEELASHVQESLAERFDSALKASTDPSRPSAR